MSDFLSWISQIKVQIYFRPRPVFMLVSPLCTWSSCLFSSVSLRKHSLFFCAGDTGVSVDRASSAIIWTVQTLAPHSEEPLHHLSSDMETLGRTRDSFQRNAVRNRDEGRTETETEMPLPGAVLLSERGRTHTGRAGNRIHEARQVGHRRFH